MANAARLSLEKVFPDAGRRGRQKASRRGRWPRALDALSDAAAAEMGELSQMLFHAGAELSSEWLDIGRDLAFGEPRAALRAGRRGQDALCLLRPDRAGALARLEARNKLEVFWQVRRARRLLGTPRNGRPFDLKPFLEKALQLDSATGFWALEGLGHDYVLAHLQSTGDPGQRLLRDLRERGDLDLVPGALTALHAGLGLAVAEHLLGGVRPTDSSDRFERCVVSFESLCRRHSVRDTYCEVALETLGLVTKVFYPSLFAGVLRTLEGRHRLRQLFWHGTGRGFYFQGGQLVPGYGSLRRALDLLRESTERRGLAGGVRDNPRGRFREPVDLESEDHELAAGELEAMDPDFAALNVEDDDLEMSQRVGHEVWRDGQDALAGLAYALTLVNRETPELLAAALTAVRPEEPGFSDGIAGALAMAGLLDGEVVIESWIREAPANVDTDLWRRLVSEPYHRLRRLGADHPLYGALPWGGA